MNISYSETDAELVKYESKIEVRGSKLITWRKKVIKINNRNGDKYSKVIIPFRKSDNMSYISAGIFNEQGELIRKLKKSDIKERSAISNSSLYEDRYIKEFILKHNEYPYFVSYSYTFQEQEFLEIDNWYPFIDTDMPVTNAKLDLTIPKGFEINYKHRNIDSFSVDTVEDKLVFHWTASYSGKLEDENFSQPIQELLPNVHIVPLQFIYDIPGSLESWKSFGKWAYYLMKDLSDLPESEKAKVLALVNNIEDDVEKIRVLCHYLQDQTRYINVTIETGGFKPYPASYVAEKKYGDCKALTNYMKSVLECAGIHSVYCIIMAGNEIQRVDTSFPSSQFNHVMLMIPTETDTIWLECTSDIPYGYQGTFTQNRYALLVDSANSVLKRTSILDKSDVLELRKVAYENDNQGNTLARVEGVYKGDKFEALSAFKKRLNKEDKEWITKKYFLPNFFELDSLQFVDNHRDALETELVLVANSVSFNKPYGSDKLISFESFDIPQIEKPDDRKTAVRIDYPIYKIDSIQYSIMDGYKISSVFDTVHICDRFGKYVLSYKIEGDRFMLYKEFLLFAGDYPLEDYEEFYKFITRIREAESETNLLLSKE